VDLSREQLKQYMSIRESQRHLRELSVQRQTDLTLPDNDEIQTKYTIGTYLHQNTTSKQSKFPKGGRA